MNRAVRMLIAVGSLALVAWIGVGVYRAGSDVPPPPHDALTLLSRGHAEGRRDNGQPSWSLDYDKMSSTMDTTTATLENVRHGVIYRHGKPYVHVIARHVVINTITSDFVATGPIMLTQVQGKHVRTLRSDAADYSGVQHTLVLVHPTDVTSDGARLRVAHASINFHTGQITLGKMSGRL